MRAICVAALEGAGDGFSDFVVPGDWSGTGFYGRGRRVADPDDDFAGRAMLPTRALLVSPPLNRVPHAMACTLVRGVATLGAACAAVSSDPGCSRFACAGGCAAGAGFFFEFQHAASVIFFAWRGYSIEVN